MNNWWEWIQAALLSGLGVTARLGHQWAQSQHPRPGEPPVDAPDGWFVVASLIAAPIMGIMGFGLGQALGWPPSTCAALAGLSGLIGPGPVIGLWDRAINLVEALLKKRGGL